MTKSIIWIVVGVIIIFALGGGIIYKNTFHPGPREPVPVMDNASDDRRMGSTGDESRGAQGSLTREESEAKAEIFSGMITAYQTDCFFDGICSVTLGSKVVVVAAGFRAVNEQGKLVGVESISDVGGKIGSQAEVYAEKIDQNNYTLYGSNNFYLKVK